MSGPAIYSVRAGIPALIISPRTDAVTVYNQSAISVYLTSEPGNTGFELPTGSTLTWDAGQYLYAFHKTEGVTADITVLPNAGVMNDTRALARAIVAEGLAPAIATEINALGVPAIDRPVILAKTAKRNILSGADVILPRMNVAEYSGISSRINILNPNNAAAGYPNTFIIAVRQWIENVEVSRRRYEVESGNIRLQFPLVGTEVDVAILAPASTWNDATIEASFIASYRNIDERIACDSEFWAGFGSAKQSVITTGQTYSTILAPPDNTRMQFYPSWASGNFDFSWGFFGSGEAAKNTTGVTVLFGPEAVSGASAARALMGDPDYTSTSNNTLRRFSGISSWTRPVLSIVNRNSSAIYLSVSYAYEV